MSLELLFRQAAIISAILVLFDNPLTIDVYKIMRAVSGKALAAGSLRLVQMIEWRLSPMLQMSVRACCDLIGPS